MANTGPYANSESWMAMAIETTRGTAAATPTYWIPVKTPKMNPMPAIVTDEALRGSMVKIYDQIQTIRHDEYTFTCYAYVNTVPALFRSLLGGTDGITGTGPYTHVIGLLNNDLLNGNQPPSYTFFDFDGYQVRQLVAAQVDSIGVKFTATGLVELSVKVVGNPFTIRGSVPSTAFNTDSAIPGWDCTYSVNSDAAMPIVDGDFTIKRNIKPLTVIGSQAPYRIWSNELELDGKLSVINRLDAELNLLLNDTSFGATFTWSAPRQAGLSLALDFASCRAKAASQDRHGDGVIVTALDIQPLPQSTDATSGGVSPVKFTAVTSQATTY